MKIEYEKIEKVVLLFWDEESNYYSDQTQQKIGTLFKSKHLVTDRESFKDALSRYSDDQLFLFLIHLSHAKSNKGYDDFINSKINMEFPNLRFHLITSALLKNVYDKGENLSVYSYDGYQEKIFKTFVPQSKAEIYDKGNVTQRENGTTDKNKTFPQIDYAIITALYQDEFEELKKYFEFPEEKQITTNTKIYHRGFLKSNTKIEVIAAIPNATGMVDASIIATQMLEFFRPKYLLMSGVCGGAPDLNFGDIIIAKQVFTFQKGKISDLTKKDEEGKVKKIELFDEVNKPIDYDRLYDGDGKLISISIEKFEVEHDSIIPLNSRIEDLIVSKLGALKEKVNKEIDLHNFFSDKRKVDIVIEPMACSTMIINKEGYFENTIRSVQRKTAAVEMESYGVARACMFANNGNTTPIIFKSVMDRTSNKSDNLKGMNVKKYAAFTSAVLMNYLFEEKII